VNQNIADEFLTVLRKFRDHLQIAGANFRSATASSASRGRSSASKRQRIIRARARRRLITVSWLFFRLIRGLILGRLFVGLLGLLITVSGLFFGLLRRLIAISGLFFRLVYRLIGFLSRLFF